MRVVTVLLSRSRNSAGPLTSVAKRRTSALTRAIVSAAVMPLPETSPMTPNTRPPPRSKKS